MRANTRLKLRAVLVGVGRLNLGFTGQLFQRAEFGVLGVNLARPEDTPEAREQSARKVQLLDSDGSYLLRYAGDPDPRIICIQGATLFDEQQPDSEDSMRAVTQAADTDVIVSAIGTGTSAQERWVNFILRVLKKRLRERITSKLDICAADNPVGRAFGTALFRNCLLDAIAADQECADLLEHLAHYVRFPLLLADRICSRIDVGDHVSVLTEPYGLLRCSENTHYFKHLESANRDTVFVDSSTLEIYRMLKLSMFNCAHAMAAYFGALNGQCTTVAEALAQHRTRYIVAEALEDITQAHLRRGGLPVDEMLDYKRPIVDRISQPELNDSIYRVGREPIRKLSRDDRISGAALLTLYNNHHVSRWLAAGIAAGLAYAYHYDPRSDDTPDRQAMALRDDLRKPDTHLPEVLRTRCRLGVGAEFGSHGAIEKHLVTCVEQHYSEFIKEG